MKSFCGEQTKHIATMIIDNLNSQSVNSSEALAVQNEFNQNLTSFAQLSQYFYQFNIHPADRLLGCLLCIDKQITVCLEPASHQCACLEIEMRDSNGDLIKKIYEKPIRRIETLNEQTDRRQLIILKPGDIFFYHPLLAQSLLFEQLTSEFDREIKQNQILGLNIFYGSADLTRVMRNWGTHFTKSASHKTPFEHLKLLDQLLERIEAEDANGEELLNEKNQLLIDQLHEQSNDDLKSINVQIFIGNSIVNLEQVSVIEDSEVIVLTLNNNTLAVYPFFFKKNGIFINILSFKIDKCV